MMLRYDTSDDKWSYQYHVRVIFHLHAFLVIVIISSVFFHLHNEYVLRQSNLSYKKYDSLDETAKHSLFKDFQAKFDRTYSDKDTEIYHYNHFKAFLKTVDERNLKAKASGGSAIHGITKYADVSPDEFTRLLGYRAGPAAASSDNGRSQVVNKMVAQTSTRDWTGIYTSAVKDQGYCGSCWAVSAVEQIESDAIREGLITPNDTLSVQQIISCDERALGCFGGSTELAYRYIMDNGGIASEYVYPYTSYSGQSTACNDNHFNYMISISGFRRLRDEQSMINYVLSKGPLSICLDATHWNTYISGILTYCPSVVVNHCVQVVGVDAVAMVWKVRNQWGSDWGQQGFIYIKAGGNLCGLASDATYAVLPKGT